MEKRNASLASFVGFFLFLSLFGNQVFAQTLTVIRPNRHVVSPPLTQIHGGQVDLVNGPTVIHHPPVPGPSSGPLPLDTAIQTTTTSSISGTAGTNFDGINIYSAGYIPSDSNIAVGPKHIMETVNAAYAVYDKTGNLLLGPNSLRSLWAGLGGECAANNGGDTVVQYDRAADRWIMTQLGSLSSPYAECIAVSQTNDPTGAYNLYSYSFGNYLNDYPKFAVWATPSNSAYLATYNLFYQGKTWSGAEICAYDRVGMINGAASPVGLCFTGINGASFLPVDVDGATSPLDGTPAYFIDLYTTSSLGMYAMSPDFANSTATLSSFSTLSVDSFSEACGGGTCVPQPGTTRQLDSLADRLMYRAALRIFPDHESIVVNHSVAAGGSSGVRWYELQSPVSTNGTFSVYQQGTFAPSDSAYRWMGSAAMDQAGDIALGYSVSSSTSYPAIRYTGRAPTDALGTMATEASIIEGSGSQTGYTRWGDYSSMRVDPNDDCTFWYVNEYYPVTSSYGWYTRIGSFKFSGCGPTTPDFSIAASPTSLTLNPGQSGNSTVTVTSLNGFNSSVALTVTGGCPTYFSCIFDLASVTPPPGGSASATLTVATSATTPAGTYALTITGTGSDGTQHTTTVTVKVSADFKISLSPSSIIVSRGSSNSVTVSLGAVNGSSSVSLTVSGLPSRTSASFTVNPVTTPGNSTLTISANRRAGQGLYTVTVTGANGAYSHSASFSLTIQ